MELAIPVNMRVGKFAGLALRRASGFIAKCKCICGITKRLVLLTPLAKRPMPFPRSADDVGSGTGVSKCIFHRRDQRPTRPLIGLWKFRAAFVCESFDGETGHNIPNTNSNQASSRFFKISFRFRLYNKFVFMLLLLIVASYQNKNIVYMSKMRGCRITAFERIGLPSMERFYKLTFSYEF